MSIKSAWDVLAFKGMQIHGSDIPFLMNSFIMSSMDVIIVGGVVDEGPII